MALEAGASWPHYMRRLRKSAANVQAVVQTPGEPAEQFTNRALERWQLVVEKSAPPHRFVLGTNEHWDAVSAGARQRLAKGAFSALSGCELILCGGGIESLEAQGRLLALAGELVEGQTGSQRTVRVLFHEPTPFLEPTVTSNSEGAGMMA